MDRRLTRSHADLGLGGYYFFTRTGDLGHVRFRDGQSTCAFDPQYRPLSRQPGQCRQADLWCMIVQQRPFGCWRFISWLLFIGMGGGWQILGKICSSRRFVIPGPAPVGTGVVARRRTIRGLSMAAPQIKPAPPSGFPEKGVSGCPPTANTRPRRSPVSAFGRNPPERCHTTGQGRGAMLALYRQPVYGRWSLPEGLKRF